MKKGLLRLLTLLFLLITGFSSRAQFWETPQFRNVLKTNLAGYIVGQFQLTYERPVAAPLSLQMSAGYIYQLGGFGISSHSWSSKQTGYILIPEIRYYFSKRKGAPSGLYFALFGRYRHADNNITDENYTSNGTGINQDLSHVRAQSTIGGGALLGYQLISRGGFTLDIFAGPQYKNRSTKITFNKNNTNLGRASTNNNFVTVGEELLYEKFGRSIKKYDKDGTGFRGGFSLGYAF